MKKLLGVTLGLATLIGRFAMQVPMFALAGFLAERKQAPETAGTFPFSNTTTAMRRPNSLVR